MENNCKFERFVSKMISLINDEENGSKKTEEKLFGKGDIAILKIGGILLAFTALIVGLRFVVEPPYWYLVDLFSTIAFVIAVYFIVIRKLFKKK